MVLKHFRCETNFWSKKIVGSNKNVPKKFDPNKFWVQNYLGYKKFGPKTFESTGIKAPKKLGPKSLVKIGSVTTEILLI